ncbi:MAG: hypothetical protein M9941_05225 [Anaerolineae bacterium]|nr:hypothetical protein [Anaerolineae bacterium]MCO5187484.1 hypothetical protein [Anaerolineae bacterium]MCO5195913.1 hypothetical protein [Anaerolineae bacterium]MCO5197138.1 hypothetical protein [Anaerolineae bacterium]
MSDLPIEERYPDVLQNLEFAIASVYREHPDEMIDYDVDFVVSRLISYYQAEQRGHVPQTIRLNGVREELRDRIEAMIELRLGRGSIEESDRLFGAPIPLDDMILCLKRIRKSIKRWNKEYGRQGYLEFVTQFV